VQVAGELPASENIALKAEGGRITPVTGSAINSLAFQCAFAF
jgi:hypothetical protein